MRIVRCVQDRGHTLTLLDRIRLSHLATTNGNSFDRAVNFFDDYLTAARTRKLLSR